MSAEDSIRVLNELPMEECIDGPSGGQSTDCMLLGQIKCEKPEAVTFSCREGNPDTVPNGDKAVKACVVQSKRLPEIPPISISASKDWIELSKTLKAAIAGELDAKYSGDFFNVYPKSIEDYTAIQRTLLEKEVGYHTYCLPQNVDMQIVICGIPHDFDPNLIRKELQSMGFRVSMVDPLISEEKIPLGRFLVKLKAGENPDAIFKLSSLFHLRVRVYDYKPPVGFTQCYSCQRYGHCAVYCYHRPRCVKCGKTHDKKRCQKLPEDDPMCCNCGGAHTANYLGCTRYVEMCERIGHAKKHRPGVGVQVAKRDLLHSVPGEKDMPAGEKWRKVN